jgi:mono/diheme cytochrome c family protein
MRSKSIFAKLWSRIIFCICAASLFCCALPPLSLAQAVSASEDGLYTSDQAAQGKKLYATRCAVCHGADLEGVTAPPLAGPQLEKNWLSTTTMDDLFFLMRTTMPLSMAKSLSAEQHPAVFAYLLQQNGYPAGNKPVRPDTPQLKNMRVLSRTANPHASGGPAPLVIPGDPRICLPSRRLL